MTKKRISKLERTAIHEAGHAVCCYILNIKFKEVSIIPNENTGTLGHVSFPDIKRKELDEYNINFKTRDRIEKRIMVKLSANISVKLITGSHDWKGATVDHSTSFPMLDLFVSGTEEADAYVNWLFVRTKALLNHPRYIKAIKELSSELLKRKVINYLPARKIIKQAIEDYITNTIKINKKGDLK